MIPLVYQEVKDLSPARSEAEVPCVAERVLRKIESLSALTKDDNLVLPSNVVQAVFPALFLSREEKKEVLPYLSQVIPTTISAVRLYIANRFQQYELMTSTLPSLSKSKDSKHPRSNNSNTELLAGAAATTVDGGADGADGKGKGGGDRGGGGRGRGTGGRGGQRRWPDAGRTSNNNSDGRPPGGRQGVKSCRFCVAKSRPDTAHKISSCPWISCASKSNLLTALPNICLGCLSVKSGTHKCPELFLKHYKVSCSTCKINSKLCRAPAEHSRSPIPGTFVGHVSGRALHEETGQAAVLAKRCVNRGSLGSASLLTGSLTLANGNDTITVEAL